MIDLVIGNGLIGRALYYYLRHIGKDVEIVGRKGVDLSSDKWDLPKCNIAYICAGVTSTALCEEFPEDTRRVNVTHTLLLAERLKKAVWISSERVFDGSKAFRKIDDEVCPITEYGRQKVEAEKGLLERRVTVIRFAKVLGWDVPLFNGWVDDLRKGKVIHPYSNMGMSALPVEYVVGVLEQVSQLEGLYQVSGLYDISYDRVAYHIANRMGVDLGLVQPIEAELPHPHTTLECNLVTDIPDVWETIYDRSKRLLARA